MLFFTITFSIVELLSILPAIVPIFTFASPPSSHQLLDGEFPEPANFIVKFATSKFLITDLVEPFPITPNKP